MEHTSEAIKHSGSAAMIFGVLQIIGGMLAIAAPFAMTGAIAWVLGFTLVVVGIFGVISAFQPGSPDSVLGGLLYFLAGAFVLVNIQFAMVVLGTVLAVFLILRGLIQIMASFQLKPAPGSGWMMFGGILALVLGIMLFSNWPLAGAMALGIFIGIELLWSGWAMLFVGGGVRGAGKRLGDATGAA